MGRVTGNESGGQHIVSPRRIGLIGCVKVKAQTPKPARELYTSQLFQGRRSVVERTCTEWWILSAEHGLVHPDQVLAPYDTSLKDVGRAERPSWSELVLQALDKQAHPRPGDIFEIHAGIEYRDFGLVVGLRVRGCSVEVSTARRRFGQQLHFYQSGRVQHWQ
jgi:hypothetical protein